MCSLYETIMYLCASKGIKPGKMCSDIRISRGLITDLKMGRKKSVNAETANKIANYFEITVDELLTGKQKQTPAVSSEGDTTKFINDFLSLGPDDQKTIIDHIAFLKSRQE